jgi:indolepyruvate ferredoxin oxidoreductase
MKHGNFAGTSRLGAVVVLSAEDHEARTSTMPFQKDYAFVDFGIPVLYPASVAEFLTLGIHAVDLSRFSGCWVAMKQVGQLCDGGQTVAVHPDLPLVVLPDVEIDGRPFSKRTDFTFFPGKNVDHERHLYYDRHGAARAYALANRLNRVEVRSNDDRAGILTSGKSYAEVRQALRDFCLDAEALSRAGIRLMKLGLTYPLEPSVVREFARGLQEIVVVEE